MQSIPGYDVGGSLHFCCDNNVAFTASGNLSRSAARPGDCALPYGSPVISVSGSSPRSVINAAKLALRFRNEFGKDVMTELVAWRKYGHNELDEPRFVFFFIVQGVIRSYKWVVIIFNLEIQIDQSCPLQIRRFYEAHS